jgi:hypothetical protein
MISEFLCALTTTSFSNDNTKVDMFFSIFDELASQQGTAIMEVDVDLRRL